MQRRHCPGALKERCNRAWQRPRRCGGNERRMIEASIAQARWVGGNRHKGCITTEILLHGTDRTL
jgi:hypothetical protein